MATRIRGPSGPVRIFSGMDSWLKRMSLVHAENARAYLI